VTFGLGVLGLILGIASIAIPSFLILTTGIVLGIFLLIYGIGELIIGFGMVIADTMVRMVFVMLGLLSMVVGILLIINPQMGMDFFVLLIGLYQIVLGLMRIAHGLNERDAEQTVTIRHL
jgi:uncharacterized membrane protein HdeD (DUF308 family)